MQKVVFIGIASLALVLSAVWMVVEPEPDIPDGFSQFPTTADNVVSVASDTMVVNRNGTDIEIRDIRSQSETLSVGNNTYALYGYDFEQRYPFAATFNEIDGSIALALLEEPLAASRLAAEQSLQDRLGISEAEMCLMNIYVGVPVSVNEFFSGRDVGLSFCPDSVVFE